MNELLKVDEKNLDEVIKRLHANDPTLTDIEFFPYGGPQEKWKDPEHQTRVLNSLVDAICVNTSLKSFKMHAQEVPGVTTARIFCRLLTKNRGLHRLDLGCTEMGPAAAKELAKGLAATRTLREFRSCFSKFGAEGSTAIFKALETNSSIRRIDMSHEEIGEEGAKAFAAMLKKNKTLLGFSLPNNGVTSDGVEAILSALLVNKTVEKANLGKISMGLIDYQIGKSDKAFERLLEVLSKNKTIVNMDLSYTMFSSQNNSITDFGRALAKNTRLACLQIECWALFPDAMLEFGKALDGNTGLARHWGSDLQHTSFSRVEPKDALGAMGNSLRGNPNFVNFWVGGENPEFKALMERNQVNARAFITKALNPKAKFTAKEAAQFRTAMNGIHEMARKDEYERLNALSRLKPYSPHTYEFIERAAEAYAYDLLVKADAKIRALGLQGLDIPKSYRPYELEDSLSLAPVKATGRKVDFDKLDTKLGRAFSGGSKGSSLAVISHRAATAGQIDELLDHLERKGEKLGAEELLYRPDKESSSLAEIIASHGKLGRVMTAENWKDNSDGLDKVEEALGAHIIEAQMPEGLTVDSIKWEIESSIVRKGRTPIRIGIKSK